LRRGCRNGRRIHRSGDTGCHRFHRWDAGRGEGSWRLMSRSTISPLTRMAFIYLALLLLTLCVMFPISDLLATGLQPGTHSEFSFRTWLAHSTFVALAVALTGTALSSAIGYAISRSRFLRHTSGLAAALLAQLLPVTILLLPI